MINKEQYCIDMYIGKVVDTVKKENRNIIRDAFRKAPNLAFLVSVHIYDECVDIPECDSVYISYKSIPIICTIQRICRCLRMHESKGYKSAIFMFHNSQKSLENNMLDYFKEINNMKLDILKRVISVDMTNVDIQLKTDDEIKEENAKQIVINQKAEIDRHFEFLREVLETDIKPEDICIVIGDDGKIYFHANQLCQKLGFVNLQTIVDNNVEKENIKYLQDIVKTYKNIFKNAQGKTRFVDDKALHILGVEARKNKKHNIKKVVKKIVQSQNILNESN